MTNIFQQASRQRLRFNCALGSLTVEDLWSLSLSSSNPSKVTLDTLAIQAHEEIQKSGKVSFVGSSKTTNKVAELQLAIIVEIIKVKEEESNAAIQAEVTRSKIEKLKELKAKKEDDEFSQLTKEEIEAQLAELQAK